MASGDAAAKHEHPGCVLGIFFGLVLLAGLVVMIALPKNQSRDGGKLLSQWFGIAAVPAEYGIRDAAKLGLGEEAVHVTRVGAPPERELPKPPTGAPPVPPGEAKRVDWANVEAGAADQPPLGLLFVHYPPERRKHEFQRLFSAEIQSGRIEDIGPMGGRMVLRTGTLRWGSEDRAFVLEREFEPGGTFRDMARVDLSSPEHGLMVKADWARCEPFSESQLETALAVFRKP